LVVSKDEEQWWTAKNSFGQSGSIPVPYLDQVTKKLKLEVLSLKRFWTWNKAYISNFSLQTGLEPFKKFVWMGGWWVCKTILVS